MQYVQSTESHRLTASQSRESCTEQRSAAELHGSEALVYSSRNGDSTDNSDTNTSNHGITNTTTSIMASDTSDSIIDNDTSSHSTLNTTNNVPTLTIIVG